MRLHALRTDEALDKETHHQVRLKKTKVQAAIKKMIPLLPQTSGHGLGLCWAALTLHSVSLPSQESAEKRGQIKSKQIF